MAQFFCRRCKMLCTSSIVLEKCGWLLYAHACFKLLFMRSIAPFAPLKWVSPDCTITPSAWESSSTCFLDESESSLEPCLPHSSACRMAAVASAKKVCVDAFIFLSSSSYVAHLEESPPPATIFFAVMLAWRLINSKFLVCNAFTHFLGAYFCSAAQTRRFEIFARMIDL